MYRIKDLLLLLAQEKAETLLLEPGQPPRMLVRGALRVIDAASLTGGEVGELLSDIATPEQRREIEACGDAQFLYFAPHLGKFSVHAHTLNNCLHVKVNHLSQR